MAEHRRASWDITIAIAISVARVVMSALPASRLQLHARSPVACTAGLHTGRTTGRTAKQAAITLLPASCFTCTLFCIAHAWTQEQALVFQVIARSETMESSAPSATPIPADPSGIIDLLNGFRRSSVLFAAVRLGVFDALAGASTSCNASQLANLINSNAELTSVSDQESSHETSNINLDSLSRLLAACVSLQLLSYTTSDTSYSLTPASAAFLTKSSPCNLAGYAVHSSKVVYPLFGGLHHSIQTGRPCWQVRTVVQGPLFPVSSHVTS